MSWFLGRPAMRHMVSLTSVIWIIGSTVISPSREASIRPRLYARSSPSCVCTRDCSVMSRAEAKIPFTTPEGSLNTEALNDTSSCLPLRRGGGGGEEVDYPFVEVFWGAGGAASGSAQASGNRVRVRSSREEAARHEL